MTKLRFILLLVFVLLIALWGIMFGGNSPFLYWDVPSLVLTPITPYIIASFIFPFSLQKKINREIFKADGPSDKLILEKAIVFFNLLKKLTVLGAIVGAFIGFIGTMGFLSEMSEPVTIGRNIGVVSICPFYATIFTYAVIEPLKGVVQKKLIG